MFFSIFSNDEKVEQLEFTATKQVSCVDTNGQVYEGYQAIAFANQLKSRYQDFSNRIRYMYGIDTPI